MPTRTVVVLPTYNERESVVDVVGRLRTIAPDVHVLVVDDNSPDGTGGIADELARDHAQVHVMHRSDKQGLGAAYLAGFAWAIQHGYEVIVECDADGSHHPEELPRLLAAIESADLVVGSRWVDGGRVVNWPWRRRLLSRAGSGYARMMLRMPQRDVTGGYRAYRTTAIHRLRVDTVASQGYCFQIELLWRAHLAGLRITEVPITFTERETGVSKMRGRIVFEAMWRVTVWGLASLVRLPGPVAVPRHA